MAADVGSMFQYWKKFDLRRLQVSAFLTFLAFLAPRCAVAPLPGASRPVLGGECAARAGGVGIDSY